MIPVFPLFVNGERQKKKGSLRRPSGMVYSFVALRGAFLGAGSALVKVLGLDDSSLKGLPYYPYDMVHWNDNIK